MSRGGKREGAGAPPLAPEELAKGRSIRMKDDDWEALGALAKASGLSRAQWIIAQINRHKP